MTADSASSQPKQVGNQAGPAVTFRGTFRTVSMAIAAGALLLSACGPAANRGRHDESAPIVHRYESTGPIHVVCTTGQVAELVRRVGAGRVEVEALMGPGIDPHLYSPAASDVMRLSRADAIVYNGLHLEGRMAELFEQLAKRRFTFAATAGLVARKDPRLREPPEFAGLYDPHIWHDAALWSDCVADVADAFATFDPEFADGYRSQGRDYIAELREVDDYCRRQIQTIPKSRRILVTAHDAFGYFGAAYGLEVHGLKGISTEEEKDLARQEELQDMIISREVPAVFVESAVAPRVVQALVEPVRGKGFPLKLPEDPLYADALGAAGSDAETYAGMLRHNVRVIVEALR